jgi:tripartite-type tricarboxylate transporter receptor subunit TctC
LAFFEKRLSKSGGGMHHQIRHCCAALAFLLSGANAPGVLAQAFPAKPIRIIVPTSPGGLNDLLSRALGQYVSESVGQPVLVENRPGGGSMIGMAFVAKSQPDGYTLCITTKEPLVYNPLMYSKLPYDPERDFSYVTHLVRTLGIIVANAAAPGNTFPEMIAYARANPGKLNWATWGPGSTPAIYLEWVKHSNGVDIAAIPYKGAGPSVPAIVSGEVHLTYTGIGLVIPHVQSGKLKALAIGGAAQCGTAFEFQQRPQFRQWIFRLWARENAHAHTGAPERGIQEGARYTAAARDHGGHHGAGGQHTGRVRGSHPRGEGQCADGVQDARHQADGGAGLIGV